MKSEQLTDIAEWFDTYVQGFAGDNANLHPLLKLKLDHSRRVAREAKEIALHLDWHPADMNVAKALGLLHDVGRFPQFAKYKTFSDAVSVDHGRYGQVVVAKKRALDFMTSTKRNTILDGIRHHNARNMPIDLAPDSLRFLKLIRDADKLDIFEVVIASLEANGFRDLQLMLPRITLDRCCSTPIMHDTQNHECSSLENVRSLGDFLVMQLSWVFDLNYKPTFHRFSCRHIVGRILRYLPENSDMKEISATVQDFVANRLSNDKVLSQANKP